MYSRIAYHRSIRMKYRSRTELASNILEAANGGATKTKIMYKAFLSYSQLKEYLAMFTQNGSWHMTSRERCIGLQAMGLSSLKPLESWAGYLYHALQKWVDTTCLMMMQKIPSRHPPLQDVAGQPSLAEGVNANRYYGSI